MSEDSVCEGKKGFSLPDESTAEILLRTIQYLNVIDSGRLAVTSKRMYYLVHQYRSLRLAQKPDVVTTTSDNTDPNFYEDIGATAFSENVQSAIQEMQTKPSLVLGFEESSPIPFSGSDKRNVLRTKFDSSTTICFALCANIQANKASWHESASGSTVSVAENKSQAMTMATFSDSTVLPFCQHQSDDRVDKILQEMKQIEDDTKSMLPSGSKRKLSDAKPSTNETIPSASTEFWKGMIVYACGGVANEVDSFIQAIQSNYPGMSIVGGVCAEGYVSVGSDVSSFYPSYTKDELSKMDTNSLIDLAIGYGDGNTFPRRGDKDALVDCVYSVLEILKRDKCAKLVRVTSGIFGVLLGGNIPLRSMVSRGVKGLLQEYSKDETRWIVHDHQTFRPGDAALPAPFRTAHIPDNYRIHIIESIRDETTGQIILSKNALGMSPLLQADFIGIRNGKEEDGFELMNWNLHASQIVRKIVVLDDNRDGSDDSIPVEIDFFELDGQSCLDDMDIAAATLKDQVINAKEEVLCALMFSCSGRGPRSAFMNGEEMADARRFHSQFPTVPCIGFYAGGEIGPIARARRNGYNVYRKGSATLQGFTAVFALFIVPRNVVPSYDLDDSRDSIQTYVDNHLGKDSS